MKKTKSIKYTVIVYKIKSLLLFPGSVYFLKWPTSRTIKQKECLLKTFVNESTTLRENDRTFKELLLVRTLEKSKGLRDIKLDDARVLQELITD